MVEKICSGSECLKFNKFVLDDPNATSNMHNLSSALDSYSINSHLLRVGRRDLLEGAVMLLQLQQASLAAAADINAALLVLAIAEEWLTTKSSKEGENLEYALKVATGSNDLEEILLEAQNGDQGNKFGDSSMQVVQWYNGGEDIDEYIKEHTDEDLSCKLTEEFKRWDKRSKLYRVRQKMGVTQESERSWEVRVLNKTVGELAKERRMVGMSWKDNGKSFLIFAKKYSLKGIYEHEYAHCQSTALTRGYRGLFFRGLNEAITESMTTRPNYYEEQRDILKILDWRYPKISIAARNYYHTRDWLGSNWYLNTFRSEILKDLGLRGFLALARLSPVNDMEKCNVIEKGVYLPAEKVKEILGDIGNMYYI